MTQLFDVLCVVELIHLCEDVRIHDTEFSECQSSINDTKCYQAQKIHVVHRGI